MLAQKNDNFGGNNQHMSGNSNLDGKKVNSLEKRKSIDLRASIL